MRQSLRVNFMLLVIFFLGHIICIFAQEKQDQVRIYKFETYNVSDIPVQLNGVIVEEENEYPVTYKFTLTNLTNIEIRSIQLVRIIFNQNGKRMSTRQHYLIVDLKPYETKDVFETVGYEPVNPDHRSIIAINSVLNVDEVWDLSIREIEKAVTSFVKGKYVEPLKVRHTKLLSQ